MRPLHKDGKEYELVHTVDISDANLDTMADLLGIKDTDKQRLKGRRVHIVLDPDKPST